MPTVDGTDRPVRSEPPVRTNWPVGAARPVAFDVCAAKPDVPQHVVVKQIEPTLQGQAAAGRQQKLDRDVQQINQPTDGGFPRSIGLPRRLDAHHDLPLCRIPQLGTAPEDLYLQARG